MLAAVAMEEQPRRWAKLEEAAARFVSMSIEIRHWLLQLGFLALQLGLPILLHVGVTGRTPRHPRVSFALSVLTAWLFTVIFSVGTFPWRYEYVQAHTDPASEEYGTYDGTGSNVAALLLGWVFPLLSLSTFCLLRRGVRALRRLRSALKAGRAPLP